MLRTCELVGSADVSPYRSSRKHALTWESLANGKKLSDRMSEGQERRESRMLRTCELVGSADVSPYRSSRKHALTWESLANGKKLSDAFESTFE
jgi:DNA-binding transcriptional regulator YdaS (Cro superfamily)